MAWCLGPDPGLVVSVFVPNVEAHSTLEGARTRGYVAPMNHSDTSLLSVSIDGGVVVDNDRFVAVLEGHHERLITAWRGFTPEQWGHPSRNADWTVHQTVRHVADAMWAGNSGAAPELERPMDGFDPRSTPDLWLEASAHETPEETIERFALGADQVRDRTRARLADADDRIEPTAYGEGHWTLNVLHVMWDSWVHERDVAVPLGQAPEVSPAEECLIGAYGLFMAAVPSRRSDDALSTIIQLNGLEQRTFTVTCADALVSCTESPAAQPAAVGGFATATDALAGRGSSVEEALPGAPPALGLLAMFFNA